MKKPFYLLLILSAALFASCRKESSGTKYPTSPSKTGSTLDLIKDSVYLYTKEDYLWNDQLPTYANFVPRSFTNADDLTALSNEVDALSQRAINPATGKPYELSANNSGHAKYSFIDNGAVSAELNGTKGDFGFDLEFNAVNDLRVEYVYPNSPAAKAGMRRGYKVTSINSNSNGITYTIPGTQTVSQANLAFISNAIYDSGSITMILKKPDSTTYTVNFKTANYTVVPVLKDTILISGTHKVGYIVFNSFTSDSNADPLLDPAFANFYNSGITDLVVDLRYNGGGYVSTAEHLDNLIVPPSKTGTVMYGQYYNANLAAGNYPLLKALYGPGNYSATSNIFKFAKSGSLNIPRVFFIITDQTASASELTINNLFPEMDVQLVGTTSYGKPVGFFAIDINKYQLYTPEFSVLNSAGVGGYYAGFTPGSTAYPGVEDFDDPTVEFGDPNERLLKHILNFVKTGTYAVQTPVIERASPASATNFMTQQARTGLSHTNMHKFEGMVFKKVKK